MSDGKACWVTLITSPSYLPGICILAHSLDKQQSRYPLLVLYTSGLGPEGQRALEVEADRINRIRPHLVELLVPDVATLNTGAVAERFKDTFTKLRAFEVYALGYTKCVFLDADMAVFKSPDELFSKDLDPQWIAANHACVCNLDKDEWAPDDWHKENCAYTPLTSPDQIATPGDTGSRPTYQLLNGGMFLFRPSEELWSSMLRFFYTTEKLKDMQFPDQDFLAEFFRYRWQPLSWKYNAIKTMDYWHPRMWSDEEVVIVHYIVDKPWERRTAEHESAGYLGRDAKTHSWWWKLFDEWYPHWAVHVESTNDKQLLDFMASLIDIQKTSIETIPLPQEPGRLQQVEPHYSSANSSRLHIIIPPPSPELTRQNVEKLGTAAEGLPRVQSFIDEQRPAPTSSPSELVIRSRPSFGMVAPEAVRGRTNRIFSVGPSDTDSASSARPPPPDRPLTDVLVANAQGQGRWVRGPDRSDIRHSPPVDRLLQRAVLGADGTHDLDPLSDPEEVAAEPHAVRHTPPKERVLNIRGHTRLTRFPSSSPERPITPDRLPASSTEDDSFGTSSRFPTRSPEDNAVESVSRLTAPTTRRGLLAGLTGELLPLDVRAQENVRAELREKLRVPRVSLPSTSGEEIVLGVRRALREDLPTPDPKFALERAALPGSGHQQVSDPSVEPTGERSRVWRPARQRILSDSDRRGKYIPPQLRAEYRSRSSSPEIKKRPWRRPDAGNRQRSQKNSKRGPGEDSGDAAEDADAETSPNSAEKKEGRTRPYSDDEGGAEASVTADRETGTEASPNSDKVKEVEKSHSTRKGKALETSPNTDEGQTAEKIQVTDEDSAPHTIPKAEEEAPRETRESTGDVNKDAEMDEISGSDIGDWVEIQSGTLSMMDALAEGPQMANGHAENQTAAVQSESSRRTTDWNAAMDQRRERMERQRAWRRIGSRKERKRSPIRHPRAKVRKGFRKGGFQWEWKRKDRKAGFRWVWKKKGSKAKRDGQTREENEDRRPEGSVFSRLFARFAGFVRALFPGR